MPISFRHMTELWNVEGLFKGFVFNLVKGDIDSEFLLRNMNFSIPTRFSRHYPPFSLDFYRTNYGCSFHFRRLCNGFNLYYDLVLIVLLVI